MGEPDDRRDGNISPGIDSATAGRAADRGEYGPEQPPFDPAPADWR